MKPKITIADLVHEALASAPESLTLDAVVAHVLAHHPQPPKQPKNSVRSTISQSPLLIALTDGRLAYLPKLLTGCSFRQDISQPALEAQRIAMSHEVKLALWPALTASGKRRDDRPIAVQLADGPQATLTPDPFIGGWSIVGSPEVWRWLEAYYPQRGDELIIRVVDALERQYVVEFAPGSGRDVEAITARNRLVADLAYDYIKRRNYLVLEWQLIPDLVVQGAYRHPIPPDRLTIVLNGDDRFVDLGFGQVQLKQSMTPEQWELVEAARQLEQGLFDRLESGAVDANALMRNILAGRTDEAIEALQTAGVLGPDRLPGAEFEDDLFWEWDDDVPPPFEGERRGDAAGWRKQLYTLKVKLNWAKRVWRTIEIRGDQTLQHLHRAIQTAYAWDDDHPYSFFMSGKAWDADTEIVDPRNDDGVWFADEVRLGALRLQQGQKFLYLFDYGDEHRFTISVEMTSPADKKTKYPRVIESQGNSPPQYPDYDE